MKKIATTIHLIFILNLSFFGLLSASNTFEFERPIIDQTEIFVSDEEYLLDAKAKNLSNTTVNLVYRLKTSTSKIPAGWVFTLCDSKKCNQPGAASESGQSILSVTGASQLFKITLYTNSTPGVLELEYETYDAAFPNDIQTVSFRFSNLPLPVLRLGRSVVSLSGINSSQSVSITSNSAWTITGIPSWLLVNSITGLTNGILNFKPLEANSSEARNAILTVTSLNTVTSINIIQLAGIVSKISTDKPTSEEFQFSPNPVGQNEVLKFNQNISFELYDMIGNLILKQTQVNKLEILGLKKGIYFIKTSSNITKKIIVD